MNNSLVKRIIVLVAAGAIVIVIVGWIQARRPETRAALLLRSIKDLHPGKSTFAEVEEIRQRFPNEFMRTLECRAENCAFAFNFENTVLRKFRLAPAAAFSGTIEVKDGKIRLINVVYAESDTSIVSVSELACVQCSQRIEPFYFKLERDQEGTPRRAIVGLDSQTPKEMRDDFYDFNLDCLSRVGGCGSAERILPSLTKKAKPKLISSVGGPHIAERRRADTLIV